MGADWTLADIMKQARREGPEKVQFLIQKFADIRIVGNPLVNVVMTQESRK